MSDIVLPYHFYPRSYQRGLWDAILNQNLDRACCVQHRRSGKDLNAWNLLIYYAYKKRVGSYYYFFPTLKQAKKAVWEAKDFSGRSFKSYVPEEIMDGDFNEVDLKFKLDNGSVIQLVGTEDIDKTALGTNVVGALFSEYSIQNPRAWNFIQPILRENQGWAAFLYTPRGLNHGWKLFDNARKDPKWYYTYLTIDNTLRDSPMDKIALPGKASRYMQPVLTAEDVAQDIREGMSEELAQQEYYLAWTGEREGSYYGKLLKQARKEGRIGQIPFNPSKPVETWWDIGRGDYTSIWFMQRLHAKLNAIRYYENDQQGIDHYAKYCLDLPYIYDNHKMPHDMNVKDFSVLGNKSRKDIAWELGLKNIRLAPKGDIGEGIDACRRIIPVTYFDERNTEDGINALEAYHKQWDEKHERFIDTPVHDWASNGADAYRTGAVLERLSEDNASSSNIIINPGGSVFDNPYNNLINVGNYHG